MKRAVFLLALAVAACHHVPPAPRVVTGAPDNGGPECLRTRTLDSLPALSAAVAIADPGDCLVLASGRYVADQPLTVRRSGRAGAPVVIAAEKVGAVIIEGAAGFAVAAPSAYVTIRGFRFLHEGPLRLAVGTAHCRVTRNVFQNAGVTSYLVVDGDDTEVDHNELRDKSTVGQMLKIGGAPTRPAERTWVHHNHFHDFANVHGNGGETIQVAVGTNSLRPAYSVVEYNLFERCNGENELVSNKSWRNVYRFNTFRDSIGELSLRDGNEVTVEGNVFIGTHGLRIFGDDHDVHDNRFERCDPAVNVGSGTDPDHVLDQPFGGFDRVDRLRLAYNTFEDNERHLVFQARRLGATSPRVAHNLFRGDTGTVFVAGDAPDGPTYEGNVVWGAADPGPLPAQGFLRADPASAGVGARYLERALTTADVGPLAR